MSKLKKEKRTQIMGVVGLTIVILGALYFFLISSQNSKLGALALKRADASQKLSQVTTAIRSANKVASELAEAGEALEEIEKQMASGDIYSWAINTIRDFKTPYNIDIPQFSQIDGPRNVTLLPQFPYQQASLTIGGTGKYTDIGRFIADMENQFPYIRLLNLVLEPAPSVSGEATEKLYFKVDVVTLIKPNRA